jgi:hypothetical protein
MRCQVFQTPAVLLLLREIEIRSVQIPLPWHGHVARCMGTPSVPTQRSPLMWQPVEPLYLKVLGNPFPYVLPWREWPSISRTPQVSVSYWGVLVDVPVTADAEMSRPLVVADGVLSATRPAPAGCSSPVVIAFVPVPPGNLSTSSDGVAVAVVVVLRSAKEIRGHLFSLVAIAVAIAASLDSACLRRATADGVVSKDPGRRTSSSSSSRSFRGEPLTAQWNRGYSNRGESRRGRRS